MAKYKPEIIEAIVSAIAATGRDRDGYEAGGIGHDTFYRWMKTKPEFSDAIQKAKAEFRKVCPENMRQQALQRLGEYLRGETVETWEKKSITTDAAGNITSRTASITTIRRPTPQWAIDRILGHQMPVLNAVQILMDEGIASPQMAAIVESNIDNLQRELKNLADLERQQTALEGVLQA